MLLILLQCSSHNLRGGSRSPVDQNQHGNLTPGWITKQPFTRNLLEILRPGYWRWVYHFPEKGSLTCTACSSKPPGLLRRSRIRAFNFSRIPKFIFQLLRCVFLKFLMRRYRIENLHAPSPAHPHFPLGSPPVPKWIQAEEGIPSQNVKPHLTPFFPTKSE